jgi:plasmid stabilization system protein ParE
MTVPVVYLPQAEDDIISAFDWYHEQRDGLGDQFLSAVIEVIDQIREHGKMFGVLRHDVRAAPLRRFPYVVFYRALVDKVVVIAVLHGRRSSRAWRDRL